MKLSVDMATLPNMQKALKGFENEIPLAVAQSITFTAERVQKDLQLAMLMDLDSPRPYTVNSVYKTSASPTRLYAQVGLKDQATSGTPASKYMQALVHGGDRRLKGVERKIKSLGLITARQYLVPGGDAPLDQHGNVPRSQIKRALENVQEGRQVRAKGAPKPRGKRYFWVPKSGVWWREDKDTMRSLLVVADPPNYDQDFDFYGIAETGVAHYLPEQVEKSIERALRRAAERAG